MSSFHVRRECTGGKKRTVLGSHPGGGKMVQKNGNSYETTDPMSGGLESFGIRGLSIENWDRAVCLIRPISGHTLKRSKKRTILGSNRGGVKMLQKATNSYETTPSMSGVLESVSCAALQLRRQGAVQALSSIGVRGSSAESEVRGQRSALRPLRPPPSDACIHNPKTRTQGIHWV